MIEDEDLVVVDHIQFNRHGWKRDNSDERDFKFEPQDKQLPRNFSLKDQMPPVLDQGKLGSCTANGICNAILKCEMVENIDDLKPRSRLFVYYNERASEGNVTEDSGAQIRDGIKTINKLGACFEEKWPYDIGKFAVEPPKEAYVEAKKHRSLKYHRVNQTEKDIKHALYTGFPIVFGFTVFESIQRPTVSRSGIIPLPMTNEKEIGGHCVVLTGWNDAQRLFQIQNSWGEKWGSPFGYGWLSYDYILNPNFASDFWLITLVK